MPDPDVTSTVLFQLLRRSFAVKTVRRLLVLMFSGHSRAFQKLEERARTVGFGLDWPPSIAAKAQNDSRAEGR